MIAHLRNLGWIIQLKKVVGVPTPLPIIEALGVLNNIPAQLYVAAPKKVETVKLLATAMLSKKTVMARDLARLAGYIMCIMIAVGCVQNPHKIHVQRHCFSPQARRQPQRQEYL